MQLSGAVYTFDHPEACFTHKIDTKPMSSAAKQNLDQNLDEIKMLSAMHAALAGPGPGRKFDLEMLNKAGVVMICGAWEAFCEDIIHEAIEIIVMDCPSPNKLPKLLRSAAQSNVRKDIDDSAPWKLAESGWRSFIKQLAQVALTQHTGHFNTPKSKKLIELFKDCLGIADITTNWKKTGGRGLGRSVTVQRSKLKLDEMVTLRGEIAHRVQAKNSVKKLHVTEFRAHVEFLADKVEDTIHAELTNVTGKTYW